MKNNSNNGQTEKNNTKKANRKMMQKDNQKRIQAEANARIIAAEAEAEANRKLSESIDSNVLRNKYYETWDGKLPSTIVGEDTASILLPLGDDGKVTPAAQTTTPASSTTPATTTPTTETTEN